MTLPSFRGALKVAVPVLLLAIGGGILAVLMITAEPPAEGVADDPGPLVRAFSAEPRDHRVAVTAYGTVQAETEWEAIAEVRGRAIKVHEQFDPGEIILAGETLVQVDPTEYENAIAQLEAQKRATEQEIKRIQRAYENAEEIIALHRQQEQLALAEYNRQKSLREGGGASLSAIDRVYRDYLSAKTAAENLQDERELMPIDEARADASLAAIEAQLAEARRNRQQTTILMPFDGFCVTSEIEQDQIVAAGRTLGTFVGIEKAEVEAHMEIRKGYMLWPFEGLGIKFDPSNIETLRKLRHLVRATVQPVSHPDVQFEGTVVRARFIDPGSRTMPIIVEVDDPLQGAEIGKRPPLTPNMFCKVTVYGALLSDVIVVPRECIHDGRVHLARDGRLHIAEVKTPVLEEEIAVVTEGIEPGDLVLLSDVFPAVERMPLRVQQVANPTKGSAATSEGGP